MKAIFKYFFVVLLIGLATTHPIEEDEDYNNDEQDYDDEDNGPPPVLIGRGQNFTANLGDTIIFPCEIRNPGTAVIQWRLGTGSGLFFERMKLTKDDRFSAGSDHSIVLKDIRPEDANDYICQLLDDLKNEIVHHLNILTQPSIHNIVPDKHHIVLKKGEALTLVCNATGYPVPKITWKREGKHASSNEGKREGSALMLEKAVYKDAGEYICMAENDLGKATASIRVSVEGDPEVKIEHESVNTGEGYDVELVCNVLAHPIAKVTWLKDDRPLEIRNHIMEATENNKHILKINSAKFNDFGKYTCIAKNDRGSSNKSISLTGNPSLPVVNAVDYTVDNRLPVISWKVTSRSPITQYELMHKKQEDDEWKTAYPQVNEENMDGVYTVHHTFTDLSTGTYQAKIRAQNKYGWSKVSEMQTFSGVISSGKAAQPQVVLEPQAKMNRAAQKRISEVFFFSLLVAYYLR